MDKDIALADVSANPFTYHWSLGFHRLVPITPISAVISERSAIKPESRGKAVGIKGFDGTWHGFDWVRHEATPDDLERWYAMGAGVGIETGKQSDGTYLIAIDADTMDGRCAAIISGLLRKRFGVTPTRFGRRPKCLYVVRTQNPVPYSRIEFGENNERLELLGDGKQFVGLGLHPITRQPYEWVVKLVPLSEMPVRSVESLL